MPATRPVRFPLIALLAATALAGCVAAVPPPSAPYPGAPVAGPPAGIAGFAAVAARVEPVAEAACRARDALRNCDFAIAVDDRPDLPPNAFQTVDASGRPYLVFTGALVAMAQNADELAFVLGHEAAHHVAGHIPRRKDQALTGAMLAGVLAQATGLSAEEVRAAQDVGAKLGAQKYSKEFELEADRLGAQIAWSAGFDPLRGAAFFDRLPDPGDRFLGSHPPNAQRKAVVAAAVREIGG
ncbi:M48 family metallopeptidase [Rhodobacter sp. Har01]|uniref:M48 family metallopeptidase n=1 Tax=Rhodobacter sp. Har01 TaxID=2883999 RepID=UPI001D090DD2|nr:M48 family metallopeptidase [Rhodobacter sp. Har01]MCB6178336.1 M48 family metallopeptidase [Rhodobacter sp. Har01]